MYPMYSRKVPFVSQEGGSRLSALNCAVPSCKGSMLQLEPLKPSSRWKCECCGVEIPGAEATIIQSALGRLLGTLDCSDPDQISRFLSNNTDAVPVANQITVQLKCNLVCLYGHIEGYTWKEMSEEQLEHKEVLCRELLQLLHLIGAGLSRMKGLILFELACTLMEKSRRCGAEHRTVNGVHHGVAEPSQGDGTDRDTAVPSQTCGTSNGIGERSQADGTGNEDASQKDGATNGIVENGIKESSQPRQALDREALSALEQAAEIFEDDCTGPKGIWRRLQILKQTT